MAVSPSAFSRDAANSSRAAASRAADSAAGLARGVGVGVGARGLALGEHRLDIAHTPPSLLRSAVAADARWRARRRARRPGMS